MVNIKESNKLNKQKQKMSKTRNAMKTGKLLARAGFNVVVAGLFFTLFMSLLGGLQTIGVLISEVIALVLLVLVIPQIWKMRKGPENLMILILGIPIGLAVVGIVGALFPNLTIPTIGLSGLTIGSFPFVIAMTSYFLADWIGLQFKLFK